MKRIKAAIRLFEEGAISRGIRRLDSNGLADMSNDAILEQMRDKHPRRNEDMLLLEELRQPTEELYLRLKDVLSNLDVTAGAGSDGCHNRYLKILATRAYEGTYSKMVIANLSAVASNLVNGRLPRWYSCAVGTGNLFGPIKTPGTNDARPCSAPFALTRAIERATAQSTQAEVARTVLPEQLGGPHPSGMHQLVLGIDLDLAAHPEYDLVVFIDVKNAHNAFTRRSAQRAMDASGSDAIAQLNRAFTTLNTGEAPLCARADEGWMEVTTSSEGGKQGSPLTGPAFRMAQNPTLKSTSELLLDGNGRLNGHAKAFEDDICLYGCASPVLRPSTS